MISIRELQNLLVNKEFNPYIDIDNTDKVLLHLVEEIGELLRTYRKAGRLCTDFEDELGDCMILLLFVANSTKTDLQNVTIEKIRKNIKRNKFKPTKEKLESLGGLFG